MSASSDGKCAFATEREFVGELQVALLNAYSKQFFAVRHSAELAVGNNIADIAVLLTHLPTPKADFHIFTTRECVVLAALRRNGATRIDILEKRCGIERSEFRTGGLRRLVQSGHVRLGQGGRVSFDPGRWPFRVVAIEAKLRRWNEALAQAIRYTQYADESFVALPEVFAEPAIANRQRFIEAGIGLIVLGEDGLRFVIEAASQEGHNWRREFVISRLAVSGNEWEVSGSCRHT